MTGPGHEELAAAFQVPPALLPFLPELWADLWYLGSWGEIIVDLLRPLGLPRGTTRAVDLGCGKGAVSVRLAQELGFHTLGIDFFEPFLRDARARAAAAGIAERCRFELADMREAVHRTDGFDVAIYASIGGVLGDLRRCIGAIRKTVVPGGYMVFDDGFLVGNTALDRPGYGHYVPHAAALRQLTAHGDRLLQEVRVSADDVRTMNREYTRLIERRAEAVAERHPELGGALADYLAFEAEECEVLETRVAAAVWLLERSSDEG